MKSNKPAIKIVLQFLLIIAVFLLGAIFGRFSMFPAAAPIWEIAKVTRVIDGDTIELENKDKVRYIGIDAPETVDPRKPVQCFGKEATEENKRLVEGKMVRLEKDVTDKDKYGRLLRYVYVNQAADSEEVFVNLELVKLGYARIYTYPPDVKDQKEFLRAERAARVANLGLWQSCPKTNN